MPVSTAAVLYSVPHAPTQPAQVFLLNLRSEYGDVDLLFHRAIYILMASLTRSSNLHIAKSLAPDAASEPFNIAR